MTPEQLESAAQRVRLLHELNTMRPADALGVTLAYLMHAVDAHPVMVRQTLMAQIEHPAKPSTSIIGLLTHLTS